MFGLVQKARELPHPIDIKCELFINLSFRYFVRLWSWAISRIQSNINL